MQILRYILVLLMLTSAVYAEENRDIVYDDFHLHNARATTHDGSFVSVDYSNTVGFDVLISGTSATVVFRVSGAGKFGWQELSCFPSDSTTPVTSTSASGFFTCNIAGGDAVSARVDECTSCAVSVVARRTTAVLGGGGGSGGSAQGLEANFNVENTIVSATSATPLEVTNGTQGWGGYGDATEGGVIYPIPLGDSMWRIWTNFNGCIRDMEAVANMLCIDPDAASPNAMYQFQTGYKPLMSFPVALEPRGAATSAAESLTTNVPKTWYLTVTDANTDAADFTFPVTASMAGATTFTIRLTGASTHASPSGNIDLDCAATTYTPGTDTIAAHSTTGEQTVLLTPATQYRPVSTTSAAITFNGGALVAGDIVYGSCEVDASATTSAQMTNFRLLGTAVVTVQKNSWGD